jgi:RNA polymerase sigma factor (TIGR02999 family)
VSSELTSITTLLEENRLGSAEATNRIVTRLYDEFLWRARKRIRKYERNDLSLNTDDVTQVTLERLLRYHEIEKAKNTHELFRAFVRAMKQALIDHIRHKRSAKRGGEWKRVPLDDLEDAVVARAGPLEARSLEDLHRALERLAEEDPALAELADTLYFSESTLEEIAGIHGVPLSKLQRDLRFAEARLHLFLSRRSKR